MHSSVSSWTDKESSVPVAHTTAQIEATYRKVTLRLVPFLFLCWVINYIDRVNVGFAKIPLAHDIGLTDSAYGLGVGLFTIGYILFEVPSNMLLEKIGARKTMSRIMLLWGIVSCSTMFITSPAEFYIARILLGAAEAGFYPGLILYLTYWFPSARRARITSRFLLAMAVSGMIGGPIAGWVLDNPVGAMGLHNWQWLFLLEGLPAILMGCITYFYLNDKPQQAKWLTDTEKNIVLSNLEADEAYKDRGHAHSFLEVLRDPRMYVAVAGYTVIPLIGVVLNYWTPTIIKQAGVRDIWHISLLSSIPFVLGAAGMLIVARHSDRKLERRWHFLCTVSLGALGLVLLPQVTHTFVLAIGCLSLVGVAYYAGSTIFWTIPPTYFRASTVAAGIALTSSMGQCGSVLAPILLGWLKTHTDSIATGLYIIAAITIVGGLVIVLGIPKSALRERSGATR
jgi:ACS family phthalate transporter-like MFS transporter